MSLMRVHKKLILWKHLIWIGSHLRFMVEPCMAYGMTIKNHLSKYTFILPIQINYSLIYLHNFFSIYNGTKHLEANKTKYIVVHITMPKQNKERHIISFLSQTGMKQKPVVPCRHDFLIQSKISTITSKSNPQCPQHPYFYSRKSINSFFI